MEVKFLCLNPADSLRSNDRLHVSWILWSEKTPRASETTCLFDQTVTKNAFTQVKSNHCTEWIQAWAGSDHMAMIMNSTLGWKLGDSVSIPSSVTKIVQQIAQSPCLYFYSIICLSFSQLIKTIASCHLCFLPYIANVNKDLKWFGYAAWLFFPPWNILLHCQCCEPYIPPAFPAVFKGNFDTPSTDF